MRTSIGIIVFIVLALCIVLFVYTYNKGYLNYIFASNTNVTVSGVSLEINSPNASCFGGVIQPLPGFNASKSKPFNYTFNMSDSCKQNQTIWNITILNAGFKTEAVSPLLPYQMFYGDKATFKVKLTPSATFYGGVLNLEVNST